MNVAIIFAGGSGKRMTNSTVPKQFLEVNNKPVLVYTIERFQKCNDIDGIILVLLKDWIERCYDLIEKYNLSKVVSIEPGGSSGYESIFIGIKKAYALYPHNSIVLIHDGVRPLITTQTIRKAIKCTEEKGSAITISKAIETIITIDNDESVNGLIDRSICQYARAPQCFYLEDIYNAHIKAREESNIEYIDSATLMLHFGHKLHTVEGEPENIKITTPSDFAMFKALLAEDSNL